MVLAHLTLLFASTVCLPPSGPPDPPSRARSALALLEGRLAQAEAGFAALVAGDPDDHASWFQLAVARHRLGDGRGASEAYGRAAGAPDLAARCHYNRACLAALAGAHEEAWSHLEACAESGGVPRALAARDPDLAALREQPAFGAWRDRLPPTPAIDPEAPTRFVEPDVRVLWEFRADDGLQRFGWQSTAVGDVDADGVSEILVGAPRDGGVVERGGKAWLLSGRDGSVLRTHVGSTPGGELGFRCEAAGDLDGDGHADYLLGAPGGNSHDGSVPPATVGPEHPGEVFVISGADGSEWLHLQAEGPGDRLGFDAAVLDDLDGDGVPELALGAPGHDGPAADAGRVRIHSGADGRLLRVHDGSCAGARLGMGAGALGDVDGDGLGDYVLGAPGAGRGAGGQARVHSGRDGRLLHRLDPLDADPAARPVEFGRFFASSAGDLDSDGVDDVYVADGFESGAGLASGRVWIFSGATGALVHQIGGTASDDWYGIGRGLHEDVDGDGVPDLVLGALAASDGAPAGGRIDVRSGRDGSLLWQLTGALPQLCLGYDVHPVGDADGDGVGDLFVTASWGPWAPALRGRGVLVAGRRVDPD